MSYQKGKAIAKIMQWAWNAGLNIQLDTLKRFAYEPPHELRQRQIEECWPVIRFSNYYTDRHQEVTARDFDEMLLMLEFTHKKIFAELGCPIFPKDIK